MQTGIIILNVFAAIWAVLGLVFMQAPSWMLVGPVLLSLGLETIRAAEMRDNEAVFLLAGELAASFVIEREAFNLSYQKLLDSPDALLAVAIAGELVIGYLLAFDHVTFFANGRVAWVERLSLYTSGGEAAWARS